MCTLFYICTDPVDINPYTIQPTVESQWIKFNSDQDLHNFINLGKTKDIDLYQEELIPYQKNTNFISVLPIFDKANTLLINEYKNYRVNDLKKFVSTYSQDAKINEEELIKNLDIDDDPIIADPYFASLLNRDREILVDGNIYKYSEIGLFFTKKELYPILDEAIRNYKEGESSARKVLSDNIVDIGGGVYYYSLQHDLTPYYEDTYGQENNNYNSSNPTTSNNIKKSKESFISKLKICNWDPNIWDAIFGPGQTCYDYYENDKRIKTKAWAQNYLIYASVGLKVKSQDRFAGIWFAKKVDELELGFEVASFKYKFPGMQIAKPQSIEFRYDNYVYDQYGNFIRYVNKPWYTDFPWNSGDTYMEISLPYSMKQYIHNFTGKPINEIDISLDGKDLNNAFKELMNTGFKNASKFLNKAINSPVSISSPLDGNTVEMYFFNWNTNRYNNNNLDRTFDFNTAQIGISMNGDNKTFIFRKPQSYKEFKINCYGIARRGNNWNGSKVIINSK